MKIISETSLANFEYWSGAVDTANRIWEEKAERALTNSKRFWKIYIPTESTKQN